MAQPLARKTALVTGAGSGIGRAAALALAAEGAAVVVAGRSRSPLDETAKLIEAAGGAGYARTADVTSEDDVRQLVETTRADFGRLDIAVNNVGVITAAPIHELEQDAWSHVLSTNLLGTWLCLKHEIRSMKATGGGSIVNVASTVGPHIAVPGLAAYGASKAGVRALSRTAAKEAISSGIRINSVSPGPVDTPMSRLPGETDAERDERLTPLLPIGRVAATQEIARAVVWLASDDASDVVGHDLVVDGGGTA